MSSKYIRIVNVVSFLALIAILTGCTRLRVPGRYESSSHYIELTATGKCTKGLLRGLSLTGTWSVSKEIGNDNRPIIEVKYTNGMEQRYTVDFENKTLTQSNGDVFNKK